MTDSTRTASPVDTRSADDRLRSLLAAWDVEVGDDPEELVPAVVGVLVDGPLVRSWQALAFVTARIPLSSDVVTFRRRAILNGWEETLRDTLVSAEALEFPERRVRAVVDAFVVDVHDTCRTTKITGIQRVVRETVRRWHRDHDVQFIAWDEDGTALRTLSDWETNSLLGLPGEVEGEDDDLDEVLVPIGGSFVATELVAETWRSARLESIVHHSGLEVDVIGYDAVPMTSSETSSEGIAMQYPLYLQAISRVSRIGAISGAAADEFGGWAHMLGSTGLEGPDVRHIPLAAEVRAPSVDDRDEARRVLGIVPERPTVLVVGSHEPRKNHLAVVQAAKTAWARGYDFTLAFIGGASWSSERFHDEIEALHEAKRPVVLISKATDELLAAAYDVADFTLFPSLHEGFGLPVAESLALGTPVITTQYGSMKEIIEAGGGGILVDPRSDASITDALVLLLTDTPLLARLAAEARARTIRTWDAWAADLWAYFHEVVA
jgi:glycosyltransferase involved in cell wall biosynthesis